MILFISCDVICSDVMWCDVMWYDMMWCDVMWYDMIWFDMTWYYMIWFDLIWFGLIWFDLIWFDLIWFELTWLDLIWCDMIWYILLQHLISYFYDTVLSRPNLRTLDVLFHDSIPPSHFSSYPFSFDFISCHIILRIHIHVMFS